MISLNDLISPANRLVGGLLRSPLHVLASKGLMVMTWTGRTSGASYAVPVGYQRRGDSVVVLISKPGEKNWWKNFRTPWPAVLTIARTDVEATGIVVAPGGDDFYDHVEGTLRKLPWMGSQFGGIKYDKSAGLTIDQKAVLDEHVAVVVFTLA